MPQTAPFPQFLTLAELPLRARGVVRAVTPPAAAAEWADHLASIGFIAGEPVQLLARARPGNDPLVVRVGDSTFALRCAEAACVQVDPIGESLAAS